jgi:sugar-specific transcriptional regulator TrmB
MINQNKIKMFFENIGLNDIQTEIYYHLLFNKSDTTINEIKEAIDLSYAQVHFNLHVLEEKELIRSSESKPKQFFTLNPQISLARIVDKKVNEYNSFIDEIEERMMISESQKGVCTKDIYHYHYTDLDLAIERFYSLIQQSGNEITITTLPPFFLKKIEPFLRNAFKRGVKITFYYSDLDYSSSQNYLDEISEIFKRLRITLIQVEEKISHSIIYNDMVVNNGHILIDEGLFNAICFKEDTIFFTEGFYGKGIVQQLRHLFKIKTIKKELEIQYPESFKRVLEVIEEKGRIKTRDISLETGISGTKLKEILDFLMKENKIVETIDNSGVGRPGAYYSIIA